MSFETLNQGFLIENRGEAIMSQKRPDFVGEVRLA